MSGGISRTSSHSGGGTILRHRGGGVVVGEELVDEGLAPGGDGLQSLKMKRPRVAMPVEGDGDSSLEGLHERGGPARSLVIA
jgi:hypothetical protein